VATILLCGVDLFIRGKLDAVLPGHRLITVDHTEDPELVLADVSRIDPEEVADAYPDIPIVGFTNHTDTSGLRAAHAAGFDQVLAKSALAERPEEVITPWGIKTFMELENSWTKVLTDDGFRSGLVKRFRRKPLVEVELVPAFEERDRYGGTRLTTRNISRYRRVVEATATHSWVLAEGQRTDSLSVGQ